MTHIREFREKHRVKLTELARAADLTASYLSSMERGFTRVTSTAASKIVNGYKSLGFDVEAATKTIFKAVEDSAPSVLKMKRTGSFVTRDQFFQAASVVFDIKSDIEKFESLAARLGLGSTRHDCPDCD